MVLYGDLFYDTARDLDFLFVTLWDAYNFFFFPVTVLLIFLTVVLTVSLDLRFLTVESCCVLALVVEDAVVVVKAVGEKVLMLPYFVLRAVLGLMVSLLWEGSLLKEPVKIG